MSRESPGGIVHRWRHDGRVITYTWVGDAHPTPARVYALALTPDGRLLLVRGVADDPRFWLPGGGVEAGETPEAALARELWEEAGATIHRMERLGAQRVDDPALGTDYHAFYWCRITLAEDFVPAHEVSECRLVSPEAFLDELFWGHRDPKAAMLLDRALAIERAPAGGGAAEG